VTRGRIERRQVVARGLEETFAFYAEPANLARITPPWLGFALVGYQAPGEDTVQPVARPGRGSTESSSTAVASEESNRIPMAAGLRLHYRIRPLLVRQRWVSVISHWDPPHGFVDEQVRGPYRKWHHTHRFRAVGQGTEIADVVDYEIGFGPAGALANALFVRRQLAAIFDYREWAVGRIFS
jgi:ligand-binding SRPBCC domain-containing protein